MRSLAVLLLPVAACSFIAVQGPPQHPRKSRCTEGRLVPALDSVASGGLITVAIALFAHVPPQDGLSCHDDTGEPDMYTTGGLIALFEGALFGIGAAYGMWATHECRELHAPG
jgi:hypothetical protein